MCSLLTFNRLSKRRFVPLCALSAQTASAFISQVSTLDSQRLCFVFAFLSSPVTYLADHFIADPTAIFLLPLLTTDHRPLLVTRI